MSSFGNIFRALNELVEEGVIQAYALGGATAILFYAEPVRTYDIDVFVFLPPQESGLISMEPLYRELKRRGYTPDAEHIMMFETPVQFLPAYNALVVEAVEHAVTHDYDGVPVQVIGPEYLAALALQTGGRHRRLRAEALIEAEGVVDQAKLQSILDAYRISLDLGSDSHG
jgi:hypothetical protein